MSVLCKWYLWYQLGRALPIIAAGLFCKSLSWAPYFEWRGCLANETWWKTCVSLTWSLGVLRVFASQRKKWHVTPAFLCLLSCASSHLLSVTDGSICIPSLSHGISPDIRRYSRNPFFRYKIEGRVHLKIAFPGGIRNRASRVTWDTSILQSLVCLPPCCPPLSRALWWKYIAGLAITRLPTRSAAVHHWRDFSLSAYERDLVRNEKVWFRSFVPNRTLEDSFFHVSRPHRTV